MLYLTNYKLSIPPLTIHPASHNTKHIPEVSLIACSNPSHNGFIMDEL